MSLNETERVGLLTPPQGKVRMVLDTDAFNEIDDQFAIVQALLSADKVTLKNGFTVFTEGPTAFTA